METPISSNRIHPLVAAASVSLILVSAVGVAAMTGLLPNSHSTFTPATVASVPPPPVIDTPVVATAPTAAEAKTESKTQATDRETVKRAASPSAEKVTAPRPASTASSQSRTPTYADNSRVTVQAPAICYDCGRVESVNAIQAQGEPSGVGMIAGGVIGGLIGNQIGGGNGKKVATVAGAVGGGYAGHQIEKQNRTVTTYQVRVRMEDGVVRTFAYDTQPQWMAGDRVRVVDGQLRSRA
jgi:outer membrane lipoprotein SlyB